MIGRQEVFAIVLLLGFLFLVVFPRPTDLRGTAKETFTPPRAKTGRNQKSHQQVISESATADSILVKPLRTSEAPQNSPGKSEITAQHTESLSELLKLSEKQFKNCDPKSPWKATCFFHDSPGSIHNGPVKIEALFHLLAYLNSGARKFIDIGANRGLFSLMVYGYFGDMDRILHAKFGEGCSIYPPKMERQPEVWAFEPAPETFKMLKASTQVVEKYNYHAFNKAISYEKGTMSFSSSVDCSEAASLGQKGQSVEVSTVDIEFPSLGEGDIYIMKVDVEGFEFGVFEGAINSLSKGAFHFIVWEFGTPHLRRAADSMNRQDTLKTVVDFLYSKHYESYFITNDDVFPVYGEFWNDYYESPFCSNPACTYNLLSIRSTSEYRCQFLSVYNKNIKLC